MANAALLIGGRSLNAPLSLAYLAITARALGAHDTGVVMLINSFALTVGLLVRFESWQAVLHYGARPLAEGRTNDFYRILRFSLLLDLISVVAALGIGVLGAIFASDLLKWPREAQAAGIAFVTVTIFMVQATPTGILRLFGRFGVLAAQSTVSSAVRVVACAIVWAAGGGFGWMLVAWYAGTVVAFVILAAAAWRELVHQGHADALLLTADQLSAPSCPRSLRKRSRRIGVTKVPNADSTLAMGG